MRNDVIVEKSKLDETVEVYRKKIADSTDVSSKDFKPKRVAAYCRVSKNIEMQESSLETQMEAYQRVISERVDWQLVEVYYDRGITGTCVAKRPGFMRMIEDCKAGKIDMIISKSISRFARNTVDTLEYTRMLKDLGIGVYFEKEKIDTGDLTSEMLLAVYAAFAQEESHSISENVRRGYKQRFQMGIPKYSKTYGYRTNKEDKTKWLIVENEAEIIREIFVRFIKGEPIRDICKDLNERGVPAPGGNTWYASSIGKMLRNEVYEGNVIMQKTIVVDVLNHVQANNKDGKAPQYYKRGHHEAIVSQDVFDLAQKIADLRSVRRGSQQYPYYEYLKCPRCGKQMVQCMVNMSNNPTVWICSDCCTNEFLLTQYIDQAVIEAINGLVACLGGYENIIREAQSKYSNGGKVDLYYLKKLIASIEIIDYREIKIGFVFGKVVTIPVTFQKPTHWPSQKIEYIDNKLSINGRCFTAKEGARITRGADSIQCYLKNNVILEPIPEDPFYRVKNEGSNSRWKAKKLKEEENNNE